MLATTHTESQVLTPPSAADEVAALRVALNILNKWECSPEEKACLLGIAVSTAYRLAEEKTRVKHLQPAVVERISYILNIHSALRVLFSLPESIYGWVRKPNSLPFFTNRAPLDVMLQGRVSDLYEVSMRLHAYRGGWM